MLARFSMSLSHHVKVSRSEDVNIGEFGFKWNIHITSGEHSIIFSQLPLLLLSSLELSSRLIAPAAPVRSYPTLQNVVAIKELFVGE